jgi:hypothetical protein
MYIEYLNFPTVPEHLIKSPEYVLTGPFEFNTSYFKSKTVNRDLMDWLQIIFPFEFTALYTISYHTLPIHKDVGITEEACPTVGDRSIAINYVINTGGNNVTTQVYDEDQLTVLKSEKISKQKWHYLTVDKFHGVTGILPYDKRFSISITVLNQKTLYKDLFNYLI